MKQFTIVGINADGVNVYQMLHSSAPDALMTTIAYERECALDCGAVRIVVDIAE